MVKQIFTPKPEKTYPTADFFVEELQDYLNRNVKYFIIDKRWLKTGFGSLTNGLEFFHIVFERLSQQSGLRFSICTDKADGRSYYVLIDRRKR